MFLKLMNNDSMPDDSHAKGCTIIANVVEAKYGARRVSNASPPDDWETYVDVTYSHPNRGSIQETFVLKANAYLMNESGRTIQSFTCAWCSVAGKN